MRLIQQKIYTKVLLIIFLSSIGLFIFSVGNEPPAKEPSPSPRASEVSKSPNLAIPDMDRVGAKITNTFTLIAGDLNIGIEFDEGATLYDILSSPRNTEKVNLKAKEYKGIGFFIERVGNIEQGNGKYVMYSINGKEASVGVSAYKPKINDVILFELK
jgi:hypothetical protein